MISRFEGYRRKAAQLPDGRWMIGYGHTLTAREGAEVSEEDAEALLLYDLIAVSHGVNEWVFAPLTQNQFDALCSFAFNIGLENFHRSGVLKRLNEGALIQAACAMELWRKAEFSGERIVIDALVRRRAVEKALFLTPPDGWPVAPTPILAPLLDADVQGLVPREPPVTVTASLDGEQVHVLRADEPVPPPAPPEEEEGASPVLAAAEAVAARLQTIFPDAPAAPAAESDESVEAVEAAPALPTAEPSFEFTAPADAEAATPLASEPIAEAEEAPGPESGQLFEAPPPANDAAEQAPRPVAPLSDQPPVAAFAPERKLIDDTAPFEFTPPIVQPLRTEPRGGPVSLMFLAVIGLAFFGGGVFWALNAKAGSGTPVTPLLVGWLAGITGVGLFSVAVFLLLQRLGRPDHDPRG